MAALPAGLHGLFVVLRKIPRIGPRAATAMTAFATFPPCLDRTRPVMREVAGTTLATDVTRPGCLFAILGEVPAIARALLLFAGLFVRHV